MTVIGTGRKAVLMLVLTLLVVSLAFGGGQQAPKEEPGMPFAGKRIRVLTDQRDELVTLEGLISGLEAQTGMKVEFVKLGQSPLDEKITLELTAPKTDLDASMLKFFYARDFAKKGLLAPLNDLASGPDVWARWSKTGLGVAEVNGRYYGVPHYMEPNILTFRADLFAKYALGVPDTMEELEKVVKTIHEQEPGVSGISMRAHRKARPNWNWSSFLHAWGGTYLDNSGKPVINSPASVASLEFYAKLLRNYGPPGVADYNWQDVQDSLASGKVGVMYDAVGLAMRLTNPESPTYVKEIAETLSFALVPKGPVKREAGFFTWLFIIPANSKDENKKATMAFLEWAFSPEIARKVGWGMGGIDVTFNVPGYKGYAGSQNLLDVYRETLKHTSPDYRPLVSNLPQIMDIVDIAINSAVAGLSSAKEALDQAQSELLALH